MHPYRKYIRRIRSVLAEQRSSLPPAFIDAAERGVLALSMLDQKAATENGLIQRIAMKDLQALSTVAIEAGVDLRCAPL